MQDYQKTIEFMEHLASNAIGAANDTSYGREEREQAARAYEAFDIAIDALREAIGRQEGTRPSCAVCVAGEHMYSWGDDTAEISNFVLKVRAGVYFETISEFDINFCPMCGRQLTGENE